MSDYSVQDLQDNLDYLAETKNLIKQAIIDKGQSISSSDTFRSYADKIAAIVTSSNGYQVPVWYYTNFNNRCLYTIDSKLADNVTVNLPLYLFRLSRIDTYTSIEREKPDEGDIIIGGGVTFYDNHSVDTPYIVAYKIESYVGPGSSQDLYQYTAKILDGVRVDILNENTDFKAENIKSGASILGTNGTFASDGDITVIDVAEGKIGYTANGKVTGSIKSYGIDKPYQILGRQYISTSNAELEETILNIPTATNHTVYTFGGESVDTSLFPEDITNKTFILMAVQNVFSGNADRNTIYYLAISNSNNHFGEYNSGTAGTKGSEYVIYSFNNSTGNLENFTLYSASGSELVANKIPFDEVVWGSASIVSSFSYYKSKIDENPNVYSNKDVDYHGTTGNWIVNANKGASTYRYIQKYLDSYLRMGIIRGSSVVNPRIGFAPVNVKSLISAESITADKIKLGETIFGITGTYTNAMKEYATVVAMNTDIANISEGEIVKVTTNPVNYYIKDTGVMVLLVKETETLTPTEYESATNITEQVLGEGLYTPVEYLQSDGSQWIDTENIFKNNYKIETKFQYYDSQELGGEPFGTRTYNGTSTENNIFLSTYQNCWFAWGNSETALATTNISTSAWELVVDKNKWYLNDTLKLTASNTTFTSATMYLFAEHYIRTDTSQNFVAYKSKTKIWYFRLYDNNNNLLLDLIPVKDENNEACMYDRVSYRFFRNKGTGTFTPGPVIS